MKKAQISAPFSGARTRDSCVRGSHAIHSATEVTVRDLTDLFVFRKKEKEKNRNISSAMMFSFVNGPFLIFQHQVIGCEWHKWRNKPR